MNKKLSGVLCTLIVVILIIVTSLAFMRKLFPINYIKEIKSSCDKYNVDTNVVFALIKAESNFNPYAESNANAKGVMQLTEDTFDFCNMSLGVKDADILDPSANIQAGVWYLSYLLKRYDGNMENALSAYNAGPVNVDKWLCDSRYSSDGKTLKHIPYGETKRHIEKIKRYETIYRMLY